MALKLKKLYDTIEYNGETWYYAGVTITHDVPGYRLLYSYCNHPVTKNQRIYAMTKNIKFIRFRHKLQMIRKQLTPKSPEQMKKEIFNSIADYRKKHL